MTDQENNMVLVVEGLAGRQTLSGRISVRGAKNAALQAFAFAPLFDRRGVDILNVPLIQDVFRMRELFLDAGFEVRAKGRNYHISCKKELGPVYLSRRVAPRLRASIVAVGPILARFGRVALPHPGGCVIGRRPIDIFIDGFTRMGARYYFENGSHVFMVPRRSLVGTTIFMRLPSVTATQTFMLAAVLARGITTIKNAAVEPEIEEMARFLNSAGARIEGAGSRTIVIQGGGLLRAEQPYSILPDRIEAGSFIILAVLAGRDILIEDCNPAHLDALLYPLQENTNAIIETGRNFVRIQNRRPLRIRPFSIKTHEYPGFPTDLQAPISILLTQAHGRATIFETIFEGRLEYIYDLLKMGARIKKIDAHQALIFGKSRLRGARLESPDLRAGLAYVIAASIAEGRSVIHNVYYIDRGYEEVEKRLRSLGLQIKRKRIKK